MIFHLIWFIGIAIYCIKVMLDEAYQNGYQQGLAMGQLLGSDD